MSLEEMIATIVRREVATAVAATLPQTNEPEPALLTSRELETRYKISRATQHRLRKAGLPVIYVGDSPRFVARDVLDWLSSNPTRRRGGRRAGAGREA